MPFSHQVSTEKEEMEEHPNELEVGLEEEEEDSQEKSAAKTQVRAQEIWRDLLETGAGRDKTFVLHFTSPELHLLIVFGIDDIQKIIQYSMKVYLLFHLAVSRRVPVQGARKSAFEAGLLRRLESTVSGLSLTRWVPVARGLY